MKPHCDDCYLMAGSHFILEKYWHVDFRVTKDTVTIILSVVLVMSGIGLFSFFGVLAMSMLSRMVSFPHKSSNFFFLCIPRILPTLGHSRPKSPNGFFFICCTSTIQPLTKCSYALGTRMTLGHHFVTADQFKACAVILDHEHNNLKPFQRHI